MTYTSNKNIIFTGAVTIGNRGILTQTGGTWAFSNNLILSGTSATATVKGNVAGAVTQSGVTSQMTLYGNMAVTGDYNLSNGNLDLNGKALTCANFVKTGGTVTYGGGTINGVGETRTWISDAPANASTGAAWDTGAAPGAGCSIIFNSTHVGACTWDVAAAMGTFTLGAGSPAVSFTENCSTKGASLGAGALVSVATGKVLTVQLYSGYTYVNDGMITGAGTGSVVFDVHDANYTFASGLVSCPATILLNAAAAASRTCSLGANANFANTLTIASAHAANTMTVDALGHALKAATLAVSTRGILLSSVAGGKVFAGDGGISVGANGTLTEANITQIKSAGTVDLSAGTYTPSATRWILTGVSKALKLAAGHILYDLALSGTSSITLTANASVSHEFIQASELNLGGFALTYTGGGENWYDRKRLHKVKATSKPYAYVPGDRILRHLGDTEAPPQ